MPTKTDNVLNSLPYTFRPAVRSSALRAVVNAIGAELQAGENTLARILRSHWVDSADKGATEFDDLSRIASMYGLSPLRDGEGKTLETIEQFRERLKRHVRTMLEGTVTVPGLLRLAADILGVHISLEREDLDPWWNRSESVLLTRPPRGEDATSLVFGVTAAKILGSDAQPARITGAIDLTAGIDLSSHSILTLQIDDKGPHDIDLAKDVPDKSRVSLEHIVDTINRKFTAAVARGAGGRLVIESIVKGPAGRIEIEDQDDDAAPAVLGIPALVYTGRDAETARAKSAADLSAGVDLSAARYLRIAFDGSDLSEIDCAGPDPRSTVLDEIRDSINAAFGGEVASHDGRFLSIKSPTAGSGSSIFIQEPAAQNLAAKLFGSPTAFFFGDDPRPATASGSAGLGNTVNLSERSLVRVRVDSQPPITINCAGADPSKTTLEEILTFLNSALGPGSATTDGGRVRLTSQAAGSQGQIVFESAGDNDALPLILGLRPRVFRGTAALPASFSGQADLSGKINLFARHRVAIAVDGGKPVEINLREGLDDVSKAKPADIAAAINAALPGIAFSDGRHVLLTSKTVGSGSRISIVPLETELRRRFTTRATILDEASLVLLGFTGRHATGESATPARLVGTADLTFGSDLSTDRWLSMSVNGRDPKEFSCAGPRPRTTTIEEIVENMRNALQGEPVVLSDDGAHVILLSTSTGAASSIVFNPVTVQDAASILGIPRKEVRGADPGRVVFTGTVDLTPGLELVPDARIKVGVDGQEPTDISLNPATTPQRRTLNEIVAAINQGLNGSFASHDGHRVVLSSRQRGDESRLAFDAPSGTDVTKAILGISPPRLYRAAAATAAGIAGTLKIRGPLDLRVSRFLNISVDGKPPKAIDCASAAVSAGLVTLDDVVNALNVAIGGIAEVQDDRLILHSNVRGSASRLSILPYVAGDARQKIFGNIPDRTAGLDATAAAITGGVNLLNPLNLSQHRLLRLSVDGSRPVEIDVAGALPAKTSFLEVLDRIDRVLPGVASLTVDGKLSLSSPTVGHASSIEVHPRRFLELVEYPPQARTYVLGPAHHGKQFTIHNDGAADTTLRLVLNSEKGVVDPVFANSSIGMALVLKTVVRAGDRLVAYATPDGEIVARVESPLGLPRVLPLSDVRSQPLTRDPAGSNPLILPRGTSQWTYLECTGPRFNEARFGDDRFAGEPCSSLGIFDLSRLDGIGGGEASIFWPTPPQEDPAVSLAFEWESHQPGAFELNLPDELPPIFGGRFNVARFGLGYKSEKFERVVFGPRQDPDYVATRVKSGSRLVEASDALNNVPIGFEAQLVPFRKPRALMLGDAEHEARIYLVEEGSPEIIEFKARDVGDWGNSISVSFRPDGPGRYQAEIFFEGDRFEGARSLVAGGRFEARPAAETDLPPCAPRPLPAVTAASPGVLLAKAAGIRARITRDRTEGQ